SRACRWACGRGDGHVGDEFLRDRLHKRRRISGFLQRPFDAVAEARLLVKIRPAFGSESADTGKYSIERLHRLFHRLFAGEIRATRSRTAISASAWKPLAMSMERSHPMKERSRANRGILMPTAPSASSCTGAASCSARGSCSLADCKAAPTFPNPVWSSRWCL